MSKQDVFPEDPLFNDLLDAEIYAIQNKIAIENMPEENPYSQFNQFQEVEGESELNAEEKEPVEAKPEQNLDSDSKPSRKERREAKKERKKNK